MMIVLICAGCLLGVFLWYLPVFQQNARFRGQILVLESQIRQEEQRQKSLESAIRALREDTKTLERVARQQLGYAKPGETVIFFEPPRQ